VSAVLDRVKSRRRSTSGPGQYAREFLTFLAELEADVDLPLLAISAVHNEYATAVSERSDFVDAWDRLVELCKWYSDLDYGLESVRSLYDPLDFDEARAACLDEIEDVLDVLVPPTPKAVA
jgi:hypothetical protein